MIDTLLAVAIATLPTTRPNMERNTKIKEPIAVAIVEITPRKEEEASKLSTCYESSFGSCWSEN